MWKITCGLIGLLLAQLIFYLTTFAWFDSGILDFPQWPGTIEGGRYNMPIFYWGMISTGAVGCFVGVAKAKSHDREDKWYRFRLTDILIVTSLMALLLTFVELCFQAGPAQ